MPERHDSAFADLLRTRIPNFDQMSLEQLSEAVGGVSHGMLSRLRAGSQQIGLKVAQRIAAKLEKDRARRDELVRGLMATRPQLPQRSKGINMPANLLKNDQELLAQLQEAIKSYEQAREELRRVMRELLG